MINPKTKLLEDKLENVEKRPRFPMTHHDASLIIGGVALASMYGAMRIGAAIAIGENIKYVSPILASLMPLGMGYIGSQTYKGFHHLDESLLLKDGASQSISHSDSLDSLKNGAKYLFVGLAIDAVAFVMGCGAGSLAVLSRWYSS